MLHVGPEMRWYNKIVIAENLRSTKLFTAILPHGIQT